MNFMNINSPTECRAIIAITNLSGFTKASQSKPNREIFDMLTEFYELVGSIVEESGGKVVKFMGDGALIVFPEDHVKQSVAALRNIIEKSSGCLSNFSIDCHLRVKVHIGSVICGQLGTATEKRFDIIGSSLNDLFRMPSGDFVISEELQMLLNSLRS